MFFVAIYVKSLLYYSNSEQRFISGNMALNKTLLCYFFTYITTKYENEITEKFVVCNKIGTSKP